MKSSYLQSIIKQFQYYQLLGTKTFDQLTDEQLYWQYNENSNSIATIVKHLWGNMLSRWTDFLTTDGEKDWRNRDGEFENDLKSRKDPLNYWEEGWACVYKALNELEEGDLEKIIYIRNQGHTVTEAINRQLAHYCYHVGQLVYVGKMLTNNEWKSLSIPKGNSSLYNSDKFSQSKSRDHFTDEFLGNEN